MKQSVRDAFVGYSAPLEGVCSYLYSDILGLVTTAIGILVDPISAALTLPLMRPDGTPASRAEIAAAWSRVKGDPKCAKLGHRYAATLTDLRLTDEGIERLVLGKLYANDVFLQRRYPDWETYPADAQLACHSLSWACGSAYRFPRFDTALTARDFAQAALECTIAEAGNPGVVPRNSRQRILLRNASVVEREGLPDDVLYWPRDLAKSPVDRTSPTIPAPPDDTEPVRVPSVRPTGDRAVVFSDFAIARGRVPLGRRALDGDLPDPDPDDVA